MSLNKTRMNPKKFFIIGCNRSGTTLLRLILESHSAISCKDEATSYDILRDNRKVGAVLNEAAGKKWIGFKIPRFTQQLSNPIIHSYDEINDPSKPFETFYRGEPLVFIVRDVRDVVCSMKNLKTLDNKPWIKKRAIPIIKYWIENSPEFRTQFDSEISKVNAAVYYDLSTCSLFWKFKNISYFKYVELKFPILKIKYEELVKQPRETINSVIRFLGLDWEESLMQHHLLPHSEIDNDGFAVGRTNARNPISLSGVGRYNNELTEEELDEICSISGDLMKSFGYDM